MKKNIYTLAFIVLLTAGCTHIPKVDYSKYPIVNEDTILTDHTANARKIKPFELTGSVKLFSKRIDAAFKVIIINNLKSHLRIETMTPFGNPISSFSFAEDSLKLYEIANNTLVLGKATNENFLKLMYLNISPEEFSELLAAKFPVKIKGGKLYSKYGKFYFDIESNEYTYGYFELNETNQVKKIVLFNAKDKLSIDYESYKKYNDFYFPTKLEIVSSNFKLSLTVREIDFLNKISPDQFQISFDTKAEIKHLDGE